MLLLNATLKFATLKFATLLHTFKFIVTMSRLFSTYDGKYNLAALITQMRDAANVEMHELEARFGTVTENGRFESSVDVTYFNQCLSMCDTYTEWDKIVPWHTRKDFFYNNFVRTMVYPKLNGTAITQCVIKKKDK